MIYEYPHPCLSDEKSEFNIYMVLEMRVRLWWEFSFQRFQLMEKNTLTWLLHPDNEDDEFVEKSLSALEPPNHQDPPKTSLQ